MDPLIIITSPVVQNPESSPLDDMRREAETNALRIVQAKLEKPENLEKLDQLRTAAAQRKVVSRYRDCPSMTHRRIRS